MKLILQIEGMHCNSCAMLIENEFEDKVKRISVDYSSEKAEIDFDEKKITEKEIKRIIEKMGYKIK